MPSGDFTDAEQVDLSERKDQREHASDEHGYGLHEDEHDSTSLCSTSLSWKIPGIITGIGHSVISTYFFKVFLDYICGTDLDDEPEETRILVQLLLLTGFAIPHIWRELNESHEFLHEAHEGMYYRVYIDRRAKRHQDELFSARKMVRLSLAESTEIEDKISYRCDYDINNYKKASKDGTFNLSVIPEKRQGSEAIDLHNRRTQRESLLNNISEKSYTKEDKILKKLGEICYSMTNPENEHTPTTRFINDYTLKEHLLNLIKKDLSSTIKDEFFPPFNSALALRWLRTSFSAVRWLNTFGALLEGIILFVGVADFIDQLIYPDHDEPHHSAPAILTGIGVAACGAFQYKVSMGSAYDRYRKLSFFAKDKKFLTLNKSSGGLESTVGKIACLFTANFLTLFSMLSWMTLGAIDSYELIHFYFGDEHHDEHDHHAKVSPAIIEKMIFVAILNFVSTSALYGSLIKDVVYRHREIFSGYANAGSREKAMFVSSMIFSGMLSVLEGLGVAQFPEVCYELLFHQHLSNTSRTLWSLSFGVAGFMHLFLPTTKYLTKALLNRDLDMVMIHDNASPSICAKLSTIEGLNIFTTAGVLISLIKIGLDSAWVAKPVGLRMIKGVIVALLPILYLSHQRNKCKIAKNERTQMDFMQQMVNVLKNKTLYVALMIAAGTPALTDILLKTLSPESAQILTNSSLSIMVTLVVVAPQFASAKKVGYRDTGSYDPADNQLNEDRTTTINHESESVCIGTSTVTLLSDKQREQDGESDICSSGRDLSI